MGQISTHHIRRRVIALLDKEEVEFLDKLSMDSVFTTGHKLSRIDIIRGLIDAAMDMELNAQNVASEKELTEKIFTTVIGWVDRRRFPRLSKKLQASCRVIGTLERYSGAVTHNISPGGLKLDLQLTGNPPHVSKEIEIAIADPSEKKMHPINMIARVIWVKEKDDGRGFEMGVAITYMQDSDRRRFSKYAS